MEGKLPPVSPPPPPPPPLDETLISIEYQPTKIIVLVYKDNLLSATDSGTGSIPEGVEFKLHDSMIAKRFSSYIANLMCLVRAGKSQPPSEYEGVA